MVGTDRAPEEQRALVFAQQRTTGEDIAEPTGTGGIAHEEVARHADPDRVDADAARDLDHHDRQRDRNTQPALEHLTSSSELAGSL